MTATDPPAAPLPAATATPGPTASPSTAPHDVRSVPLWWRDTSGAAFWGILLFVTALWVAGGGVGSLGSPAGGLTSLGRLAGLLASALMLVQVLLMARVPWFEQAWGQDELVRLHRWVGFTSFTLVVAHVLLVTTGYAAASPEGLWGTVVSLVVDEPGILLAVAGTAALVMVVVTSLKRARARLRYESWHLIHLYGYLGAGLALPHQLWTGQEFVTSRAATVFWWSLYAVALGSVLVWRVGVPLWRSLRSPIRVVSVEPAGPGATTVTVAGDHLGHLPVRAGQFLQWRFLDGPGWSRAHPYSLSAAPEGRTLRFTAAHVGDGSSRLASLRPGTRVLLEGPYGRLHAGVRTRRKVLLMGAGIGITPMRALLEGLDQAPGDVTVVHRYHDEAQRVLGPELEALATARGARYVVVPGARMAERSSWLPATVAGFSDAGALLHLVPDVADHDVYLCGAPAWMEAARDAALAAGVPSTRIHLERFTT